jgi:hypothetical protein
MKAKALFRTYFYPETQITVQVLLGVFKDDEIQDGSSRTADQKIEATKKSFQAESDSQIEFDFRVQPLEIQ